jgi:hypothetical protein
LFTLELLERDSPRNRGVHQKLRFGFFVRANGGDLVVTAKVDVERHLSERLKIKGDGPEDISHSVIVPGSSLRSELRGPSVGCEIPAKMEDWSDALKEKLWKTKSVG